MRNAQEQALWDELMGSLTSRHTGPESVVDEVQHVLGWLVRLLPVVAIRQLMRLNLPRHLEVTQVYELAIELLNEIRGPHQAQMGVVALRMAIPSWLYGLRRDGLGPYLRVRLETLEHYAGTVIAPAT